MQKSLLDIISQHVAHVEFVVAFAITSLEALLKIYGNSLLALLSAFVFI